jgi:TolB protein
VRRTILGLAGAAAIALSAAAQPPEAIWVTAHSDRNPTVSPDGKRIIFQSDRAGEGALYTRAVAGGPVAMVPGAGSDPTYPDWSPDGKRIAFAAVVDGQEDIFVMNLDGSGRVRLTDHPAREGHPRWSHDGARVFFNSERVNAERTASGDWPPEGEDLVDIFSVATDGSDLRRHTHCRSECSYPSVSPDGSKLLYRRVYWSKDAAGKPVRNSEIAVSAIDGSGETNITRDAAYDVYPIWSHDGRHIYFSSQRPLPNSIMHMWRIPAQGGEAERISSGEWGHRQGAPDRQGEKIYVFAFKRVGGVDIGHIASVVAPRS